jgi:hypothetical protein
MIYFFISSVCAPLSTEILARTYPKYGNFSNDQYSEFYQLSEIPKLGQRSVNGQEFINSFTLTFKNFAIRNKVSKVRCR